MYCMHENFIKLKPAQKMQLFLYPLLIYRTNVLMVK